MTEHCSNAECINPNKALNIVAAMSIAIALIMFGMLVRIDNLYGTMSDVAPVTTSK